MSVHITNTDFLKLLLQTDLKYRDSYWVLQTREHLAKMSDITGRRLSREESIVNETEAKTNPTPPTPIIHEHKIVQNIIQPPTEFSLNEIVSWRKSTNNLQ